MPDHENFFQPGDLIYSCDAFASIVISDVQGEYCESCFRRDLNLKRCSSCKFVAYCSKKCQKNDWSEHKIECKYLNRLPKVRKDNTRVLGKIILKLKGKDLKAISDKVGPYVFSFDDLESEDVSLSPSMAVLKERQFKYLLETYLGEDNLPDDTVLTEIIKKTIRNGDRINSDVNGVGLGLFIGCSFFPHSCIPNAACISNGKRQEIRAIAKIPKDGWKMITVQRTLVVNLGNPEDNYMLKYCKCTDCVTPYGDSVLTKVLDKDNAYFVIQKSKELLKQIEVLENCKIPADLAAIEAILQKQKGILGDTNILRLRLLFVKCHFCATDTSTKKRDLKQLLHLLELVFGKYSHEHLTTLLRLKEINVQLKCLNEVLECDKKMFQIFKVFYGEYADRNIRHVTANLSNQLHHYLDECLHVQK